MSRKRKKCNSCYKRFHIREIVYDFYVAGIGNKAEIEAMEKEYPEYWKDD